MGRLKRRMQEEYAQEFSTDERFNMAYRKVKKIKGFYSHLKVYFIVNVIIIISNLNPGFFGKGYDIREHGLLDWHTYSTALFWGIGLLIHAISVFGPDTFFSKDWEQKKIQEYMERDAQNNTKWE